MNTIENNKKLAEFLGWEQYLIEGKNNGYKVVLKGGFAPIKTSAGHLQFHSDWNWLMLVVDKIESLDFVVQIHLYSCFIKTNEFFINNKPSWVSKQHRNNKIEAVYNACVGFVKWYNSKEVAEE